MLAVPGMFLKGMVSSSLCPFDVLDSNNLVALCSESKLMMRRWCRAAGECWATAYHWTRMIVSGQNACEWCANECQSKREVKWFIAEMNPSTRTISTTPKSSMTSAMKVRKVETGSWVFRPIKGCNRSAPASGRGWDNHPTRAL
jgi:hypothetical protein